MEIIGNNYILFQENNHSGSDKVCSSQSHFLGKTILSLFQKIDIYDFDFRVDQIFFSIICEKNIFGFFLENFFS